MNFLVGLGWKYMKTKLKPYFKTANQYGPNIISNTAYLVESISLLIVAYFNYTTAHHAHLPGLGLKIRVAASLVIGLRGAYEMIRYLAIRESK